MSNYVPNIGNKLIRVLDKTNIIDFIGPLLLRIYLAPVFILAGWHKLSALEDTAYYFGENLGLPAPMLMALLAGTVEFAGGIALIFGLALRLMIIPMMITMAVAAYTDHWENGIEFSATYFIMLVMLFFSGAGRYISLDYWIARKLRSLLTIDHVNQGY